MRHWLVLPFATLALGAAPVYALQAHPKPSQGLPFRPQRIVSLNMCADQYLVALADRSQVAALTRLSRDPNMSAVAAQAASWPVSAGTAEDILAMRPDLVIAAPGFRRAALDRLTRGRTRLIELDTADTAQEIAAQIRQIAAAIGQPARGEALIARMRRDLAALPANPGRGGVAAYYQRRGYLTGTGTLVDDLMRRVGLTNLATRLGTPPLARIGLEQIALARPDFLIVETATDVATDRGAAMLHHPLIAPIPRLRVPEAWTVCGGPAYVRAAQSLTAQLRRAPQRVGTGSAPE
ncbi:ABC transporter substrate-binding protein [Sphingomonas sp. NBWT7]|uniref:ABC transporter substrate-binding protein n=1 Tax=Sphingomonas sp. NBWT7 TaxID=2596913 RepID=UPI001623EDD8|nr:ABC transporter substrate-binding protein [Sphingomonas sp. NBWT7]QNE32669.1 ABC transporter substrate-binding protein [Sphingomonas sp. NBWT7]